jgi:hypothetical protein
VACAKFGWADAHTAWWLRRVDPDRRRGITCFWWYLTFGVWKVALTATLTMAVLTWCVFVFGAPPPGNLPPSPVLYGALIAAGCGFGLSFLSSYVAMWAALRNGLRIWLGIAPHRARARCFWPPCHGQTNFVPYVTLTTMFFTIAVFLAALVVGWACVDWMRQGPVAGLLVLPAVGLTSGTSLVFQALCRRLVARSPEECWPVEPAECALQVAVSCND